ncbi:MAG: Mur ligase family protein [Bacteroidales bacterium]|nr:Mur ligase family protein [Bacteroidales bacterium]
MDFIKELLYPLYLKSRQVTTDSRNVTPGCLFFALKGEHFDGNAFAAQALQQGAAYCVVSDAGQIIDNRCLLVPDVLKTLQDLAKHHRSQLSIPVIGVTGTNGKTTTKELMKAVLSRRYKVHATTGNLNNHLGVPLTILSAPENTDLMIVEMGASHQGEINMLCQIAQPSFGLITTVGKAHLEGFGSFEGVVQAKTELYRYLAVNHGTAFVNENNEILMDMATKLSTIPDLPSDLPGVVPPAITQFKEEEKGAIMGVVTYGSKETAEVKGTLVGAQPYLKLYFEEGDEVYSVQTQLVGAYNFANAMAAACAGRFFMVPLFDIKEALEQYAPANNRSEYRKTKRNELILDCYNANPSSMEVAIDSFTAMTQMEKWAIVGSMKELGQDSHNEHIAVVNRLLGASLQGIILIGNEFQFTQGNEKIKWFPTSADALSYLMAHPIQNAVVLLKGSNSNKMWELEKAL